MATTVPPEAVLAQAESQEDADKPKPDGRDKNAAASDLARRRAESLTPEERSRIAKKAAKARWGKKKRK